MTAPKSVYEATRPTAREILVRAGGDAHALHSVASRDLASGGTVRFTCTCGASFRVLDDGESAVSLRNVSLVAS